MPYLMSYLDIQDSLQTPITRKKLIRENEYLKTSCNAERFPFLSQSPLLYPFELIDYCENDQLQAEDLRHINTGLSQYIYLSSVKWASGNNNLPVDDYWYKYHLSNWKDFAADAEGAVLDIGVDNIDLGKAPFSDKVSYLSLDPMFSSSRKEFRVFGLAEFLPFQDGSFDNICYSTSLDHVFDWYNALRESARVLRKNGFMYIESLIWNDHGELYKDCVHFHHFREFQLLGAMKELGFNVVKLEKKGWKNESHRSVLFLKAQKL